MYNHEVYFLKEELCNEKNLLKLKGPLGFDLTSLTYKLHITYISYCV